MSIANAVRLYFANPAVAFVAAWLLVLLLCAMRWAPAFSALYTGSMQLAGIVVASYLVGYAVPALLIRHRNKSEVPPQPAEDLVPNDWLRLVFCGWLAVSAYEVYASGGLPLFWLSDGSGRTYDMFGVRGLHGFMNSLWMFLSLAYLVNLNRRPTTEKVVVLALLVIWVFLVISRALMLLALVQCAAYILASNSMKFRYALPATLIGFVVVGLSFGALGDARQPEYDVYSSVGIDLHISADVDPYTSTGVDRHSSAGVDRPLEEEEAKLVQATVGAAMSAMTWGYVYLVSPVATLALNVAQSPPEYSVVPYRALALFLPTIAKRALGMDETFEGDFGVLAHGSFNVSTAFREFYANWGMAGIVIFAVGLGLVSNMVWRLRREAQNLPLICAFSMCAAYTVFNNQFFQPMILTYLFLLIAVPRLALIRSGRKRVSA